MSIPGFLRLTLHRLRGARVRGARQVTLGARVRLGSGALLDARGAPIRVGDGAWIGRGATILTQRASTALAEGTSPPECGMVTIGPGAWLGPRCLLMPGARIGTGAVVATEALVLGEVAAQAIVAGAPARLIGWRHTGECLEFRSDFSQQDTAPGDKSTPSSSP
jgi:acetyltransferase-like isoleucine patch superfamily enzyme